jgi:hypothetical protein
MLTAAAYDIHVEQLLERMRRFHGALDSAGIPYRIVGGMAVFIHVSERDPEKARLTADVDAGVARADLPRIIAAAEKGGFRFRHVAGVDMLVDAATPRARSSVHLVFVSEKVRPGYVEPVPASEPVRTKEGILIAPVVDLVHMKLTSFRLRDKVHIQDLDSVGLITPEIEQTLSPVLMARLAEVRASD